MNSKTFCLIPVFLWLTLSPGYAQDIENELPPISRIIFYRNTGALKSASACKIYLDQKLLFTVKNHSASTCLLPPGNYSFNSELSIENVAGKAMPLTLEADKLYFVEISLQRTNPHAAIPSAGYSFVLSLVSEKRISALLKQKEIAEAIKNALWEEMLETYSSK